MKEPRPWLDTQEIPGPVRDLLQAAEPPRSMTHAELARSSHRLAQVAGASVVTGMLVSLKSFAMAALLGAAGGVVVVGGVTVLQSSRPLPKPEANTVTPVVASQSTMAAPKPTPSIEPEDPPPTIPSARPTVFVGVSEVPSASVLSAPNVETMAQEVAMLESARKTVGADPSSALRILREHALQFPNGRLAIEREFMAADALRRLGRTDEARQKARALVEAAPDSPYAQRLRPMLDP